MNTVYLNAQNTDNEIQLRGTVYANKNLQGGINVGASAYDLAVSNGFRGTVEEWLASLKGAKGDDGYTPIKNVDYFDGKDGYTPIKGIDYFDGEKGDKGDRGEAGQSATHFWNGTILSITSASGTSSANLKGEQGIQGERGLKGDTGNSGVYIGEAPPVDESVNVWISDTGEATTTEQWVFTLEDGTEIVKEVYVK